MRPITVSTTVAAPLALVWDCWTKPEHVTAWNQASDDWHCPSATNDLRVGGTFVMTMAAKDGSASFAFTGTYTRVDQHRAIGYRMPDGRAVLVTFTEEPHGVVVTETFDPETENPLDMQRDGWQAILESFRRYAERRARTP